MAEPAPVQTQLGELRRTPFQLLSASCSVFIIGGGGGGW